MLIVIHLSLIVTYTSMKILISLRSLICIRVTKQLWIPRNAIKHLGYWQYTEQQVSKWQIHQQIIAGGQQGQKGEMDVTRDGTGYQLNPEGTFLSTRDRKKIYKC